MRTKTRSDCEVVTSKKGCGGNEEHPWLTLSSFSSTVTGDQQPLRRLKPVGSKILLCCQQNPKPKPVHALNETRF